MFFSIQQNDIANVNRHDFIETMQSNKSNINEYININKQHTKNIKQQDQTHYNQIIKPN